MALSEATLIVIAPISALLYVGAAALLLYRLRGDASRILPALLVTAAWSASAPSPRFDVVLIAAWTGSFLFTLRHNYLLADGWLLRVLPWLLPVTGISLALFMPLLPWSWGLYGTVMLLVVLLMVTEALIRASHGSLRALGIAMGTLFLFLIYFYVQIIAVGSFSEDLLTARTLLSGTIALMLCLTPFYIFTERRPVRRLGLSRPLAFTTTSSLLAGFIISFFALVGLAVNSNMSEMAETLVPFLVFLCILIVGFNLGSSTQRARIRVWVNKHFFESKHEYSREWKRLSERLSSADGDDFDSVSLAATMAIYNATDGALYVLSDHRYTPQITGGLELSGFNAEQHEAFMQQAASGWIFVKGAADELMSSSFELVPGEIAAAAETLVVVPLPHGDEVIGFIVLVPDPMEVQEFDWEDLDLLKMVARQVANVVAFQLLTREQVVREQFETYHQFTTFVMHDLKNLVAQQEMVVTNAGRFLDNPEFVADAIDTIENSVQRMKRLIRKINEHDITALDQAVQDIYLDEVIREVSKRTAHRQPVPNLVSHERGLSVAADLDSLVMAITHLVTNAQDACDEAGEVTLALERSASGRQAVLRIADTGSGMSQAFIDKRLFRPFDSTKKTVGMGIGAYQSRSIISKIGGSISVTSTPGAGTCFTVSLPLAN